MIRVKNSNNEIIISGHANFDDYGKDIVCASVSSIITTSVNDMYVVDNDAVVYTDNGQELIVKIIKENELINKLFNNLVSLLKDLAKDYPKNIKVESEE